MESFTGRHLTDLGEATCSPQEDHRLQIHRVFLGETLQCMEEAADDLVDNLVVDQDGVRASESEDRKMKRILVPASPCGQTIYHGVNRNLKHITIVTCLAASGKHLTAYLLTFQDSRSLRVNLQKVWDRI
jgi:hypothetical protein